VYGRGGRAGLAVKEVLNEGGVRGNVRRGRVPARESIEGISIIPGNQDRDTWLPDIPSDQDLPTASKQVHHAPVVLHIHGDLLISLDMRQGETVPDLDFAARPGGSRLGRSDAEQGSDHSWLFSGFTGLVVQDLSENRGMNGDEGWGSSVSKNVEHVYGASSVKGPAALSHISFLEEKIGTYPDVLGRLRWSADEAALRAMISNLAFLLGLFLID
jgi:hypothetical protein